MRPCLFTAEQSACQLTLTFRDVSVPYYLNFLVWT